MRHTRGATLTLTPPPPPPAPASSTCKRPAASKSSAPGKVQLAAVVYHETMGQDVAGKTTQAQHRPDDGARDTHQLCATRQSSKLSRLFSRNKQPTKPTTLIDSAQSQSSSNDSTGRELGEQSSSPVIHQHHHPLQLRRQQMIARTASMQTTSASLSDRADSISGAQLEQPVIEFKFDLIVDRDELAKGGRSNGPPQNRLQQTLEELVESFVLHSNDVCIISTGKKFTNEYHYNAPKLANKQVGSSQADFEYLLNELCAQVLAYSFDLITGQSSADTEPACDWSVELGATLFLASSSNWPSDNCITDSAQLDIVDLLFPANQGELAKDDSQPAASTLDCKTLEQALGSIRQASSKLASLESSGCSTSKLLIVSLKLKRTLNGGLFTNRMCIIDFDTKFYELEPIIESIFSGQALAHLKKRKHHLETLDALGAGQFSRPSSAGTNSLEFEKQLLRAECLLYRQLSSALIRTMVIVHVRKLSAPVEIGQQQQQQDRLKLEQQIMADNLELLEFARSIQRASTVRLRRRKRHLRSQLASSNLSVASNASFDTTTSGANHELLARARNQQVELALRLNSSDRKWCMHGSQRLDALSMHSRRHRHRHQHHQHSMSRRPSCGYWHERSIAGSRCTQASYTRQRNTSDLTESSSVSTSSGSQTTTRRADASSRRQSSGYLAVASGPPSDSDSITSAFLNSCSSSSACNQLNRLHGKDCVHRHRRRWRTDTSQHKSSASNRALVSLAAGRFIAQSEELGSSPTSTPIELCSMSPTSRPSSSRPANVSVIQIDSYPVESAPLSLSDSLCSSKAAPDATQADKLLGQQLADNMSDTCSVVAEPPKQLKLEEFLTKLNSVIAPISSTSVVVEADKVNLDQENNLSGPINYLAEKDADALVAAALAPDGYDQMSSSSLLFASEPIGGAQRVRQAAAVVSSSVANDDEDEDEDDDDDDDDCRSHSSILEHLSSLALESTNRLTNRVRDNIRGSIEGQQTELSAKLAAKTTGHLQTLLNNSNQLRKANSPRVVTVAPLKQMLDDCRPSRPLLAHTKLTSNESTCSSSSSSSSSSHSITRHQPAAPNTAKDHSSASNLILGAASSALVDQKDLYAVVMRSHQDRVRT